MTSEVKCNLKIELDLCFLDCNRPNTNPESVGVVGRGAADGGSGGVDGGGVGADAARLLQRRHSAWR